jgi:hypothetical protein
MFCFAVDFDDWAGYGLQEAGGTTQRVCIRQHAQHQMNFEAQQPESQSMCEIIEYDPDATRRVVRSAWIECTYDRCM